MSGMQTLDFQHRPLLDQRPPVMCLRKPCHHALGLKPIARAVSKVVSLWCRAALTPFMANNSLGADSYKWILYGDDDTVSFLHAWPGLLEHAVSMAAIHSAQHTGSPEMCLAGTAFVEDFLRQRRQCCWLAEASLPSAKSQCGVQAIPQPAGRH